MDQELNTPQESMEQCSCKTNVNSVPPKNNLALAIFTTACCCLPIGIYAIILSNKVNTFFAAGQPELAEEYAAKAKQWSLIGIGVGLLCQILYGVLYGAAFLDKV